MYTQIKRTKPMKEANNKTVFIAPNLNSFYRFIFNFFRCNNTIKLGEWKFPSVFEPIIKSCSALKLYGLMSLFFSKWKRVKNAKNILILDNFVSERVLSKIRKNNPDARIVIYCWNIVVANYILEAAKKFKCELYSFDKLSAIQYNIKYNKQPYPVKKVISNCSCRPTTYDVMFVGYDKNRTETIQDIASKIKSENLASKIIIRKYTRFPFLHPFSKKINNTEIRYKQFKYSKTVSLIKQSKCLLEIVPQGQTALTIRVAEALAFKKKLITNNSSITKEPFYNKNNIYIYGEDSRSIKEFLDLPYVDQHNFAMEHNLDDWFDRFEFD